MQQKTDLEAVKKLAKVLLYTELHKTKMSPIIVSHFFTSTGIADVGSNSKVELIDITASEENLYKWQRETSKYIDEAKSAREIFYMVNNPYCLFFLRFIATQYGLMFRNEEIEEEIVYNGKTFPPYYYSGDTVISVALKYEDDEEYAYLPCEDISIEKAFKRLGAPSLWLNKSIKL